MILLFKRNYFAFIILACAALYISMHIYTYKRLIAERQNIMDSFRLIDNRLGQIHDSLHLK